MDDPRYLKWRQIPRCCARMMEMKAVRMGWPEGYPMLPNEPEKHPDWADEKPTWVIACKRTEKSKGHPYAHNGEIEWDDICEAIFCPFCAKKLPEIVKKEKVPEKLALTDGYYCLTCHERCDSCDCAPLTACWEQQDASVKKKKLREQLSQEDRGELERIISAGLKTCISDHGNVTRHLFGSAAKRVVTALEIKYLGGKSHDA